MPAYRIALADDHVMFRLGLKKIIERVADLQVVGEADNGLELLRLLKRLTFDLVILDISMPGLRGIETIHEVHSIHPHLKVLVLTMHNDMEFLTAAISAGASGYLLKEDSDGQLFAAIEKIRLGGIYVSPKLADHIAKDWMDGCRRVVRSPLPNPEPLTNREREVLKLTAEGKSSKEIAELLCISYRTVEHHRAHILAKLNLKRTADLVSYAIARGYL